MSNSNTNNQQEEMEGERRMNTPLLPSETPGRPGANEAIADSPLHPLLPLPSLGAARVPPPSFQLHAAEHIEGECCQITADRNEATTRERHLASTLFHHRHAKPTDAIPALDTFKRNWYQDWFADRSVEKTDPYGFTSVGTTTPVSPNISRVGSPVPAMGGNYATARRASLDQHYAATGQVRL
ncbi:hypothetical protein BU16DRAFT_528054 [Lophium mytilinum]|uniref:Uncharacterized protein n=1 Tax=Lophium mytilinum TaxID=390894 RepID=A0A6A6QNZ6_9PEZI|nr:hypothetical protein BU16DRAFT_528054 [Lophium mytilinum]